MNLEDLRLFAAVATTGSFARAAEEAGVGRSTLTRVVQRLEAECGVALLHRTTRRVGLTGAGAALLRRVQPSLDDLTFALEDFSAQVGEPAGVLRVTTSTDIGVSVLAPAVAELARKYPRVRVETILTLRAVDLVAERVDVALRAYARSPDDPTLRGRRLMDLAFGWYASPDYLARRGVPEDEHDLVAHTLIAVPSMVPEPHFAIDDSFFGLALIRAGAGVGMLPCNLCAADEAEGAIVRVLPRLSQVEGQLWFVYPPGKASPNVEALREVLVSQLGAAQIL